MSDLQHRVRVFVFRYEERRPQYLLLRGAQGIEAFWTPLHGPIGFGEKLETAIRREVMDDVGLAKPAELIDLRMPARWLLGDEEVVEWNFGFQASASEAQLRLDKRWADFRWAEFAMAYPSLELEIDRAAIMRLHTMLQAA
jgi:hypothetical protein